MTESDLRNERVCAAFAKMEREYPGIQQSIKGVFTGGLFEVVTLLYERIFTEELAMDAYAAYDSDKRVNGPDDFEAFRDAVLGKRLD